MLRILLIFLSSLKGRTAGRTENLPRGPPFDMGASWPGDSAGPACICPGPSLSRHGAVEEGHDLRPGAGRAGLKGSGSGALGHLRSPRPRPPRPHSTHLPPRPGSHASRMPRESPRPATAAPPPERGANPVRGKGSLGDAGGDALLHSPQNCLIVVAVGAHIREGILLFGRLRRAVCPPQEGHKLGPCASAARGEGRSGDTGGDPCSTAHRTAS